MSDTTRWSHTRLSTYLSCPRAYQLRYIIGEPAVASDAMKRGRDVHEAIERYAAACYRSGKRPVKSDFDAGYALADAYPGCEELIRRFVGDMQWDWGNVVKGDSGPVEVLFTADLPNGDTFTGRIDLLQHQEGASADDPFAPSSDEWWITDWKSGFSVAPEDEAPTQLVGYAWLVQQAHPEAVNFELRIQCVGSPWSPKPWRVEGDLSWVRDKIMATVERIHADSDYEANVGAECLTCTMIHACPHAKSATMQAITESVDAQKAGEVVALADAAADAQKKLLRKVVQEHGPVVVGDSVWAFFRSENLRPENVRVVAEACEQHDMSPWQYLSMTGAQFAKLLNAAEDKPELLAVLDKMAEVHTTTTFALRKAEKADGIVMPETTERGLTDAERKERLSELNRRPRRLREPRPDDTVTHAHATDTAEPVLPIAAKQ